MSAEQGQPPVAPPVSPQAPADPLVTGASREKAQQLILRAIECATHNIIGDDGPEKPDEAKTVLALSQAFLLLDPKLDTEGLPAEGPGSKAHAQAQAALLFPPKVELPPDAKAVEEKNKPKSEAIGKDRAQKPTPNVGP